MAPMGLKFDISSPPSDQTNPHYLSILISFPPNLVLPLSELFNNSHLTLTSLFVPPPPLFFFSAPLLTPFSSSPPCCGSLLFDFIGIISPLGVSADISLSLLLFFFFLPLPTFPVFGINYFYIPTFLFVGMCLPFDSLKMDPQFSKTLCRLASKAHRHEIPLLSPR